MTYEMDIAGLKRDLPLCKVADDLHIGVVDRKPVLLYKLLQKGFLICDAL